MRTRSTATTKDRTPQRKSKRGRARARALAQCEMQDRVAASAPRASIPCRTPFPERFPPGPQQRRSPLIERASVVPPRGFEVRRWGGGSGSIRAGTALGRGCGLAGGQLSDAQKGWCLCNTIPRPSHGSRPPAGAGKRPQTARRCIPRPAPGKSPARVSQLVGAQETDDERQHWDCGRWRQHDCC